MQAGEVGAWFTHEILLAASGVLVVSGGDGRPSQCDYCAG
jgi:hypothetical protein